MGLSGKDVEVKQDENVEQEVPELKFSRARDVLEKDELFNKLVGVCQKALLVNYSDPVLKQKAVVAFQIGIAEINQAKGDKELSYFTNGSVFFGDITGLIGVGNESIRADIMSIIYLGGNFDIYGPLTDTVLTTEDGMEVLHNWLISSGVHPQEAATVKEGFCNMITEDKVKLDDTTKEPKLEEVTEAISNIEQELKETLDAPKPLMLAGGDGPSEWTTTDTVMTVGGIVVAGAALYFGYNYFFGDTGDEITDTIILDD